MSYFLGEVVRWTPGDDYALVKPVFGINDGHVHTLTPREIEIEFLEGGRAAWHRPGKRCQVGRKIIFQKEAGEPTTKTANARRLFSILPVVPEIVITEPLSAVKAPPPIEKKLQRMATQLTSSGAHELGHEFRVYLKWDTRIFDYFGPFGQQGATFNPPLNLSKIKRYEAKGKGLTTIYLEDLDLEILKPSLTLEKIEELPIPSTVSSAPAPHTSPQPQILPEPIKTVDNPIVLHSQSTSSPDHRQSSPESPMLSVALHKLRDNLPVNALRHDLKILLETLQNAKNLSDAEKDLLSDALLEGIDLGEEVQRLLPILHEHVDLADYFDKELQAHKKKTEQQIKNELERRLEATMDDILQEQERVRVQRESVAREQERLSALMEEHRQASQQLEAQKKELRNLQSSKGSAETTPIIEKIPLASNPLSPSTVSVLAEGDQIEPSDAVEVLRMHPPLARLQAAWSAGRIPLACGPRSLRLMKRYADLICGGLMRWVSVDPLLTQARDLIGTFQDGWFRPHPSGIASLLLKADHAEHPTLVVLEGANRAPLELVLEPFLHSRESGSPLFAPEAFKPEDPWQVLAQTPWPKGAFIGCTLTTGQAIQSISPVLWDRLMAVDESGWPKKEPARSSTTYMPLGQFSELATPSIDPDTEEAIQQFREEVADSEWAIPGAIKLAGLLEDLGVPNATIDTFVLSLGCAALCAGADVESESLTEHETKRLERLCHYLV